MHEQKSHGWVLATLYRETLSVTKFIIASSISLVTLHAATYTISKQPRTNNNFNLLPYKLTQPSINTKRIKNRSFKRKKAIKRRNVFWRREKVFCWKRKTNFFWRKVCFNFFPFETEFNQFLRFNLANFKLGHFSFWEKSKKLYIGQY